MQLRQTLIGLLTLILLLGTGAKGHKLVERWMDPDFQRQKFKKLLVIAITDDLQSRKDFENRFVSHLRGKSIEAVTSYSLVTDLTTLDGKSKEEVLASIDELEIDGAISVRTVRLKEQTEAEWGEAWGTEVRGGGTIRQLIDETLPIDVKKSKNYGVEVALWHAEEDGPVWGGRTNPYTREQMRKGASDFVQFVMYALELEDLL